LDEGTDVDAPRDDKTTRRPTGSLLRRGGAFVWAFVLLIVPLGVFLLWPVGLAVAKGFMRDGQFSLFWVGEVLASPDVTRYLLNGAALACVTTAMCFLLAVPLAVLRARCSFRGQTLLGAAVLLPLILPPFVGALSMKQLLGRFGVLNAALARMGWLEGASELFGRLDWFATSGGSLPPDWLASGFLGVAVLQTLHLFPILYLNASAALANIDPAYSQASRNLGAGRVRTFFSITLPLMRPGLFAGGTLVFIWSFTDIGTPLILGYRELVSVEIFDRLTSATTTGWTFALVFVMLSASVSMYVLGKFVFGRASRVESSKATVQAEPQRLGLVGTPLAWLAFGAVIGLAVLPHIGVVLYALSDSWPSDHILPASYSLRHLTAVIEHPKTFGSIVNSLQYAGASTVIDVIFGGIAAWLIVRSRVLGRRGLDALVMLPLAVPGIILAAGYVAMTVPGSWLESIGPHGRPFGILVIAYSVRRLPFVVRGISAGLEQAPESLEEAARTLGAGRFTTAMRITVPLIAANIIAGAVLVFAFSMLEVSDSLILAQTARDYPITKQIYELSRSGTPESAHHAAALGVLGMGLLASTMGLAAALLGKRLGAIFRA